MVTKEYLEKMGYISVRQLNDGTWVGLTDLLFTTGLCIGLDLFGWQKRYCFEDPNKAFLEILRLKTFESAPTGWIAKRPED